MTAAAATPAQPRSPLDDVRPDARDLLVALVEATQRGSTMYVVVAMKNAEAFLAIEAQARPAVASEDHSEEHWHRGPSESCSICKFATQARPAVASEGLRAALRKMSIHWNEQAGIEGDPKVAGWLRYCSNEIIRAIREDHAALASDAGSVSEVLAP